MRRVQALVVGSGAGGATTAATLAAAGVQTLVLEEGPAVPAGELTQFSQDQMRGQYRHRGQLLALGAPPITYAEGRCLGGSTEINSGLYHRPSPELLAGWTSGWGIEDLTPAVIDPICAAVEHNLHVSGFPVDLPPASAFLARGADQLGWRCLEAPRWFDHRTGQRQSMSVSYLRFARDHGATVESGVWVRRLLVEAGRTRAAEVVHADGRVETVGFDTVFVCGGAVQSAALLLRSGVTRNVGRTLSMHPTVKAVAFSPQIHNDPQDVPVTQVREFAPDLTIGGSATNPPLLALALLPTALGVDDVLGYGGTAGIYYAAIRSGGRGRVRVLPGRRDPLVTFRLPGVDFARLRAALGRLLLVLLAAGSDQVVASVHGAEAITGPDQIPAEVARMTRRTADLMTVHVCSSVPMGENRAICAVDSFGASHEVAGLVVNDASIVNGAPGINPQGTVMALAIRNAEHYVTAQGHKPAAREFV
ncbi:MAG TPA: GMC family oxidoreductase [Actinomycetota bacterium]|nr:GMC family oxidoreductase [Actinomycetota bacterium]